MSAACWELLPWRPQCGLCRALEEMDLLSQGQQGYFPLDIVTSGDHVDSYIARVSREPPRKVCLQPQDQGWESRVCPSAFPDGPWASSCSLSQHPLDPSSTHWILVDSVERVSTEGSVPEGTSFQLPVQQTVPSTSYLRCLSVSHPQTSISACSHQVLALRGRKAPKSRGDSSVGQGPAE